METADAYGARASLKLANGDVTIYRLSALSSLGDVERMPHVVKILLENVLRNCGMEAFERSHVEILAGWKPGGDKSAELPFLPGARALAGLHRGAGRRGHRGDADGDGEPRRQPVQGQPAAAGRPRDRPLGPGRSLRLEPGLRRERRAGVRAQHRTVPASALGAASVRRHERRAAGDGHLPSGQPRIPVQGRSDPDRRRHDRGAAGHAGRDRLAHHDGQRPRGARLGRGRDRGRGRDARPAAVHAGARGRRRPPVRRATRGRHRHRPRPDDHPDAAQGRRGGLASSSTSARACAICPSPTGRRSGTCRRSTARRPATSRSTTRPWPTCG